jgi:hypothetical protein
MGVHVAPCAGTLPLVRSGADARYIVMGRGADRGCGEGADTLDKSRPFEAASSSADEPLAISEIPRRAFFLNVKYNGDMETHRAVDD